jgi:DNA repair protein RadC
LWYLAFPPFKHLELSNVIQKTILAHNHPSGTSEPSPADHTLTQALTQALALIDVRVLDHFVVAGRHIHSFAEHGQL